MSMVTAPSLDYLKQKQRGIKVTKNLLKKNKEGSYMPQIPYSVKTIKRYYKKEISIPRSPIPHLIS